MKNLLLFLIPFVFTTTVCSQQLSKEEFSFIVKTTISEGFPEVPKKLGALSEKEQGIYYGEFRKAIKGYYGLKLPRLQSRSKKIKKAKDKINHLLAGIIYQHMPENVQLNIAATYDTPLEFVPTEEEILAYESGSTDVKKTHKVVMMTALVAAEYILEFHD